MAVFPKRKGKKSKPARLTAHFEAPAGKYYVWLRGSSDGGNRQDSVYLRIDGKKVKDVHGYGFGNWRSRFVRGAYAWSTEVPDYLSRPIRIKGNGDHRLTVTTREGEVRVDQVWLSRSQKEWPAFAAPVRIEAKR